MAQWPILWTQAICPALHTGSADTKMKQRPRCMKTTDDKPIAASFVLHCTQSVMYRKSEFSKGRREFSQLKLKEQYEAIELKVSNVDSDTQAMHSSDTSLDLRAPTLARVASQCIRAVVIARASSTRTMTSPRTGPSTARTPGRRSRGCRRGRGRRR